MNRFCTRLVQASFAVCLILGLSGQARAGIVSVTASGPGGTASNIAIGTTNKTNDSIGYFINFTKADQVVFTITVDGPGTYILGLPYGGFQNSTSATFANFYVDNLTGAGSAAFNSVGYSGSAFNRSNLGTSPDYMTHIVLSGPPGLTAGNAANLYTSFSVNTFGTSTIRIALSPVPEPSSLAMCGLAGIGGFGLNWARLRRKA